MTYKPKVITYSLSLLTVTAALIGAGGPLQAQEKKPNIVIIWGDDIGQSDISAYTMGLMGFHTPNIDRIAKEGIIFTDYYGEQSCTAGRSAFITGQSVFRTGLSKVGLPGADHGMRKEDPTIAELLKPLGYATGQFGKNHLGDKDDMLPTNHGFDEFYGNLYHLNAEEEPELPDYPKNPEFRKRSGDKDLVLGEAFRVLKPGGRFAVSDVVVRGKVSAEIKKNMELWVGCVAGALSDYEYVAKLAKSRNIDIEPTRVYSLEDARSFLSRRGLDVDALAGEVEDKFVSAFVRANKPAAACCAPGCCS